MQLALTLISILALCCAIVAVAVSIYNFARMTLEVRSSSNWWVNLIPFIALAMPNALTSEGVIYRSRFSRWFAVAALLTAVVVGAWLGAEA